jgi:hypothetical protein
MFQQQQLKGVWSGEQAGAGHTLLRLRLPQITAQPSPWAVAGPASPPCRAASATPAAHVSAADTHTCET